MAVPTATVIFGARASVCLGCLSLLKKRGWGRRKEVLVRTKPCLQLAHVAADALTHGEKKKKTREGLEASPL